MLSARRVTSSLLRQRSQLVIYRLQQSVTLAPSPSFAPSVAFRSFSQQKSETRPNYERKLAKRSKPKVMDLPTAFKTVQEIHDSDAAKLTKKEALILVKALVKHNKHDECIQLFRVFQEQNVPLKDLTRVSGFSVLCLKEEFRLALREFEILQTEEVKMKPWMYAAALDAATNTNQWDAVQEIFTHLVTASGREGQTQVEVTGKKVSELLGNARERGLKLSEFALRALLIYAEKSQQPKMALDVFSMLRNEVVELGIDVYASMFVACGVEKLWSDVMVVFDAMPETLCRS